MKVNSVANTGFESRTPKKKYISDKMRWSIQSILLKMNSEVSKRQEGDHFKTTINTSLKFNNDVIFTDERRLKEKLSYDEQMRGFSTLGIGKKTKLDIDNETGEIIDYKKPFYKPFFLVIKNAESVLSSIRTNFNLKQVVKKEYLTINDLAPEGVEKMKQFVLKVEKERLENITKQLEEKSK